MRDVTFTVDAERQRELLAAASFAVGYLRAMQYDKLCPLSAWRRDDLRKLVARLDKARRAVHATQKAECAA